MSGYGVGGLCRGSFSVLWGAHRVVVVRVFGGGIPQREGLVRWIASRAGREQLGAYIRHLGCRARSLSLPGGVCASAGFAHTDAFFDARGA
jgi:hypothetical protein